MRLSSVDATHVIDRFRIDLRELLGVRALRGVRPGRQRRTSSIARSEHDRDRWERRQRSRSSGLDVRPYPHQQRMLERADGRARAARPPPQPGRGGDRHGQDRRRGARLQAARRSERGRDLSLLFVAHRERDPRAVAARPIRAVLRDGSFGEIHGGGPGRAGRHVFAMIQSLSEERVWSSSPAGTSTSSSSTSSITRRRRPTDRLLDHLDPRELLGLTATPERIDGAGRHRVGSAGGSPLSCGSGRRSTRASSCRSSTSASRTAPTSAKSDLAARRLCARGARAAS